MSLARLQRDMVEACQTCPDVNTFAGWTLSQLDAHIGFDSAIIVPPTGSRPRAQRNKGAYVHLLSRVALDRRRYMSGLEKSRLAAVAERAYLDTELFSARERRLLPFYAEIVRPQGITSQLGTTTHFRGQVLSTMFLCRHGGAGFRARELESLRRVVPLMAMAEAALTARVDAPPAEELTPRERQIVEYLCRGFRNQDIATVLGTSANTVRNQLQRLFTKTSVASRAELVGRFLRR